MQGHFILVGARAAAEDAVYLVVCSTGAEALERVRAALDLDSGENCRIVGGVSDDEVTRRGLGPLTMLALATNSGPASF